jgi:hypothetical protein
MFGGKSWLAQVGAPCEHGYCGPLAATTWIPGEKHCHAEFTLETGYM